VAALAGGRLPRTACPRHALTANPRCQVGKRTPLPRHQWVDERSSTLPFALTVLQRRLASSPEAIYRSLVRRAERLERRRDDLIHGHGVADEPAPIDLGDWDDDEHSAEEVEQVEEELLDAATAARAIEELNTELVEVGRLIHPGAEKPRKLIIFTEHRDTLDYLAHKIRSLFGKPDTVQAIHGGVRRADWDQFICDDPLGNSSCTLLAAIGKGRDDSFEVIHAAPGSTTAQIQRSTRGRRVRRPHSPRGTVPAYWPYA
jgi:hypothetical protein